MVYTCTLVRFMWKLIMIYRVKARALGPSQRVVPVYRADRIKSHLTKLTKVKIKTSAWSVPGLCRGLEFFLKTYLPWASDDRKFTCPPKKFTFPLKDGRKLILIILFHVYLTWRLFLSFLPGHNASCRDKEGLILVTQFKRGHNVWRGWTCLVVKAESCLHFLIMAELPFWQSPTQGLK